VIGDPCDLFAAADWVERGLPPRKDLLEHRT